MLSQTESTPLIDTWSENSRCKNSCGKSSDTVAGAGLFWNTEYGVRASVKNAEKLKKCEDV